jgi:hypothetical protein
MPAVGSRQPLVTQYLDAHGNVQSIRLFAGELTAVSLPGFLTQHGTLMTALDGVTMGNRSAQSWGEETVITNTLPGDTDASVATELLVRYRGATTEKPFSFRIPTADYSALNWSDPPNGDTAIISGAGASAATTALIAALEAVCKSPDDETEAIVVVGIHIVE